ncbi:MAG: FtsX-like permease family protein [Steroidobacteraceae bacterium]
MRLDVRPILSALRHRRTGATLVALQIAITLAVAANAAYIAAQAIERMRQPTGMDVKNVFVVSTGGFTSRFDYNPTVETDLRYLRSLDGVRGATITDAVPMSGSGADDFLTTAPHGHKGFETRYLDVDEGAVDALGLRLIAGRPFSHADVVIPKKIEWSHFVPMLIVTRAWAHAMFPSGEALGRVVYDDASSEPARIVGIVDHLLDSERGTSETELVALGARRPFYFGTGSYYYIVRARPGERDLLMRTVAQHLAASNPDRVIDWVRPLDYFQERAFAADIVLTTVLSVVCVLLLAVAALGAFGLISYQVGTRTKEIGTRRALGARRADILQYFLLESALVTTAGNLVGTCLALAVGYWLTLQNQFPRLNLLYLVGAMMTLWVIGQLATWRPASRAAAVSPSVATRTV